MRMVAFADLLCKYSLHLMSLQEPVKKEMLRAHSPWRLSGAGVLRLLEASLAPQCVVPVSCKRADRRLHHDSLSDGPPHIPHAIGRQGFTSSRVHGSMVGAGEECETSQTAHGRGQNR
jgi:hypothetical protein